LEVTTLSEATVQSQVTVPSERSEQLVKRLPPKQRMTPFHQQSLDDALEMRNLTMNEEREYALVHCLHFLFLFFVGKLSHLNRHTSSVAEMCLFALCQEHFCACFQFCHKNEGKNLYFETLKVHVKKDF
jgi:hypothetical protein